ncbi:hypothetical protein QYF61_000280 [Mycteria americana]|uniref:Uncharacterized protein n=1 Tax=Mycteria americana TaxID=33587 RepID=A0AAN7S4X1_MYCAM|nr:hypothetical protein QYF61_000280 [Mycteria americana]
MEVNGGADIQLQPVEDPTPEQVDVPEGGCDPVGSPCWRRLLAEPVNLWREEPTLEQLRTGSDRAALVGTWPPGSTRHTSVDPITLKKLMILKEGPMVLESKTFLPDISYTIIYPRGLHWDLSIFNIFIDDLEEVKKCTLVTFADDSNLGLPAGTLESRSAILKRLEKWANRLS